MYYLFSNGSEKLLDQMLDIEASFIDFILAKGWTLVHTIQIIMVCCCCATLVVFTIYIPYFLTIEHTQKLIVQFVYRMEKDIIAYNLNKCTLYKDMIDSNAFMNDNQKSDKRTL